MKTKNVLRLMFLIGGAAALYYVYKSQGFSDLRKRLKEELGDQEQENKSGFVGMADPVKKLTAEEFSIASGVVLAANALAASHPRYYSINTEPVLFGVELEDSDSLKYDFRFCGKEYDGDISGMYYEWTTVDRYPREAPVCEVFLNEKGQGVCRWEDETRKYTISMTEGASLVKLVWMRQRLCTLMS